MKKNAARLEGIAAELCTLDTSSLPPAGDAVQWIEEQLFAGLTKTQLREALQGEELPGLPRQQASNTPDNTSADELQAVEPSAQPKARTLEEFMALQPKPRAGLCGLWLRAGALAMVAGDSGAGKTWFCLDLALSVSTGVPFMGRWSVPYARKVLVVSGEDDIEDLQERLSSLLTAKTKTAGRELSPLLSLLNANDLDLLPNGLPNLGTPEGRAKVEANLEGVSLVILDNYSVLFNGVDENDAREFAPVQDWFFWFKARGIAVLLVSHTGKNGDHRGSSKKVDGLNATILLNHPANWKASDGASFDLKFKKSRDARGAEVEPFSAKLGEDEQGDLCWLFDTAPPATPADAKPTKASEILALFAAGKTQKEIEGFGYAKSTISVVLSKARLASSPAPAPNRS
jgi:putative DNA primase/helicase